MSAPIIRELSGVVDGVNKVFTTAHTYKAGSIVVWLNGLLVRPLDEDGWTEISNTQVELTDAPLPNDTVNASYIPT